MGWPVNSVFWPEPMEALAAYGPDDGYLIYNNLLPAFADVLKKRVKSDMQNVIVITGGTGSGKSNLGIGLCRQIERDWSLKDNYIYSVDNLKSKLKNPKASPVSLFDEGSVSLNSLDSTTRDGRDLAVLFDTMRSRHWTTIVCIPSIWDLNRRIREHHVDYMLECPKKAPLPGFKSRGFFKIYKHTQYTLSGSSYWQNIGTGIFDPISTRLNNEYQKLKRESQDKLISKFLGAEQ